MVNASAKECAELKADYEIKAEVAKEAKKKYDLAVADHFDLIRTRREGRGKPEQKELFDKADGHAAAQDDQRTPAEVLAAGPGEDDAWKAEPVTVLVPLGLKLRYAQALGGEHGLDTLGKLHQFTEPTRTGFVAQVPGPQGGRTQGRRADRRRLRQVLGEVARDEGGPPCQHRDAARRSRATN
jgi:hypothetical protein